MKGCEVVLTVIGASWVNDNVGSKRLDDPSDYVRLEIEMALDHEKHILPVLIETTRMPAAAELPPSMRSLARRHATRITLDGFRNDIQRLLEAIIERMSSTNAPSTSDNFRQKMWRTGTIFFLFGSVAAVCTALLTYWTWKSGFLGSPSVLWVAIGKLITVSPLVVAWPLASVVSGFRSMRTLLCTTLIFVFAWICSGVLYDLLSPFKDASLPIIREAVEKLAIAIGWAAFTPRLRRAWFVLTSIIVGAIGASLSSWISLNLPSLNVPFWYVISLSSLALNLPMFVLIGLAISSKPMVR